jgi:hypothetical protein
MKVFAQGGLRICSGVGWRQSDDVTRLQDRVRGGRRKISAGDTKAIECEVRHRVGRREFACL